MEVQTLIRGIVHDGKPLVVQTLRYLARRATHHDRPQVVRDLIEVGYKERYASLYAAIHALTDGGSKGIEVFNLSGCSLDEKLAPVNEILADNPLARAYVERMFQDEEFRTELVQSYLRNVRPKLA